MKELSSGQKNILNPQLLNPFENRYQYLSLYKDVESFYCGHRYLPVLFGLIDKTVNGDRRVGVCGSLPENCEFFYETIGLVEYFCLKRIGEAYEIKSLLDLDLFLSPHQTLINSDGVYLSLSSDAKSNIFEFCRKITQLPSHLLDELKQVDSEKFSTEWWTLGGLMADSILESSKENLNLSSRLLKLKEKTLSRKIVSWFCQEINRVAAQLNRSHPLDGQSYYFYETISQVARLLGERSYRETDSLYLIYQLLSPRFVVKTEKLKLALEHEAYLSKVMVLPDQDLIKVPNQFVSNKILSSGIYGIVEPSKLVLLDFWKQRKDGIVLAGKLQVEESLNRVVVYVDSEQKFLVDRRIFGGIFKIEANYLYYQIHLSEKAPFNRYYYLEALSAYFEQVQKQMGVPINNIIQQLSSTNRDFNVADFNVIGEDSVKLKMEGERAPSSSRSRKSFLHIDRGRFGMASYLMECYQLGRPYFN